MGLEKGMTLGRVKVGRDHFLAHLLHADLGEPSQAGPSDILRDPLNVGWLSRPALRVS